MRLQRVGVVSGAVLSGVLLVAGCSSGSSFGAAESPAGSSAGSDPASSPARSSAASSPSSDTGATGAALGTMPPAVSTSRSSAAGGGPGLCTPTVTRLSVTTASGADNHFGVEIHVVNASSTPCATTGYPGVAQLGAGGQQLQQAQRTPSGYLGGVANGTSPSQITLQPGAEATALLEGLNGNPTGPACAGSPAILFTLPDNTDSTRLTTTTQVCMDLQIHPMVVGQTGSQSS